jgi:DNA (cytosine-5)-methyltransferase 1
VHRPYRHLLDVVTAADLRPLSHRAAAGFLERTRRSKLRFDANFVADVEQHVILAEK